MLTDLYGLLPALLAAGALAGLLAGLLGVGGGLVIVPVLFEILSVSGVGKAPAMLLATGTSLAVIAPTAVSSSLSHWRRGNVDTAVVQRWLPVMLLAVVFGAWLAPRVPPEPIIALFAMFAFVVAANNLLPGAASARYSALPGLPLQMLFAALIGFVCVLLGLGAGTLGVAVLTTFSVPVHRAVGTAAVLGLVIAIPGALVALLHTAPGNVPAFTVGHISLPAFFCIAPLAIICAPLGVRLGARLAPQRLQQVFAGFLIIVGLRMLSRLF